MSWSVRERRPGVWELRPYLGRDPLTGKKRYASRVVRPPGKRDAQAQCDRWAIELVDGDEMPTAGTFGDLAAQWIAVKERRWPPNTLQEHRRIVARNLAPLHDADVTKITTHTLDVLYAELAARGGACTHRPWPGDGAPARRHSSPCCPPSGQQHLSPATRLQEKPRRPPEGSRRQRNGPGGMPGRLDRLVVCRGPGCGARAD
jgi:hypothetical protein